MTPLSFTLMNSPVKAKFTTKEFAHLCFFSTSWVGLRTGVCPPSKLHEYKQLKGRSRASPLARVQEEAALPELSTGHFLSIWQEVLGLTAQQQLCPKASLSLSILSYWLACSYFENLPLCRRNLHLLDWYLLSARNWVKTSKLLILIPRRIKIIICSWPQIS